MLTVFFGWSLSLTAILLIIIVLIQRGRGGGLAGALGGAGGQSAFGTKAGDLFTKITIGLAAFWILFCIFALKALSPSSTSKFTGGSADEQRAPANANETVPVGTKSSGATGTSASRPASTSSTPSGASAPAASAGSKSAAPTAPATK